MKIATFLLTMAAAPAFAQSVPVRTLSQPTATFPGTFTQVTDVRELSDGRVIVIDFDDRLLHLLNSALTTSTPIGRRGAGPGEYQSPAPRFLVLGKDSTGLLDALGGRLLVIDPGGKLAGSISPRGTFGDSMRPLPIPAQASDALGHFFARGRPAAIPGTTRAADTVAIERWTLSARKRDTIGFIPLDDAANTTVTSGMSFRRPNTAPFIARRQWAVSPDGRVAIVSPDPYRVDMIAPSGARRVGSRIQFTRVRVTDGHKQQWREDRARAAASSRARSVVIVRGGGPPPAGGLPVLPVEEPDSWPEFLPPFPVDAVRFASDGRLWVQRTTASGEPPTFDVFDSAGILREKVILPRNSRLVGFGDRVVYVARRDSVDLEHLEKYVTQPR